MNESTGECAMDALKLMALALIAIGALALAYGGFTYTKETHTADLGPIQLSVDEKERVTVPLWAGLGAVLLGGVLLVVRVRS
jgi:TRAP-type C4-dicarboxylate transport system permease small subunit